MFALNGDDVWTILHIISLSVSSGARHGKKAEHITRPPHGLSFPGTSASTSTATSEISNEGSWEFDHESHKRLRSRLKMLENDLVEVTQGFSRVNHVTKDVSVLFKSLEYRANMLQSVCRDILLPPASDNTFFPVDQLNASIRGVADVVLKLKSRIPITGSLRVESVSDLINHLLKMPTYQGCLAFQNFEKNYKSLDQRSQQCLFCFSAFPEGSVVNKKLMMYWWVGEGLIDPEVNGDKIAEEVANEIVKQFLELQFVEPVTKNGTLVGLQMSPIIRYAVAYLAERATFFDFDFDFEWNPTSDFRLCHGVCFTETPDSSSQQQLIEGARLHPEKLRTLFNFNRRVIDIGGKWFRKIRNVSVLFLGAWDEQFESTFELRGSKSLKWLKRMKHLRFLGLQGFSTSSEFLGAIGKLENLRILTLCDTNGSLSELPNSITSLRSLTHLEFNYAPSNYLPKVIGQLAELQVLKGFVVSGHPDSYFATLYDLGGLKKLRKLSIIAWLEEFPRAQDLEALWHITSLRKLAIFWTHHPQKGERESAMVLKLPPCLQKLDLQGFPKTKAPDWLMPDSLKSLKKLYIRGGNLRELGENDKWNVKILRLINLPEFHMDWRRVEDEFPDSIYLETNKCPKLTSFPCDANGVWLKKEMLTEKLLEELGFSWSFLATYPSHEQRVLQY